MNRIYNICSHYGIEKKNEIEYNGINFHRRYEYEKDENYLHHRTCIRE